VEPLESVAEMVSVFVPVGRLGARSSGWSPEAITAAEPTFV
jgi:hypothetical protein